MTANPQIRPVEWIFAYLLHAVIIGQFILLSIWAAIATREDRTVSVICGGSAYLAAVIGLLVSVGVGQGIERVAAFVPMFIAAALTWLLAIPMLSFSVRAVARRLGVLRRTSSGAARPPATQWTVRQMLLATLATGAVITLARAARPDGMIGPNAVIAVLYLLTVFGLAIGLVWALLGVGSLASRLLVLLGEVALLASTLGYVLGGPDIVDQFVKGCLLLGPVCLLVGATLLVVRSSGFRIVPAARLREEEIRPGTAANPPASDWLTAT